MASDHEDEDDDLYGTPDVNDEQSKDVKAETTGSSGDEPMDEGADSGDDEDDDSESDLEIIIDKPPIAPKPALQSQPTESKAIKIEAPPQSTSTSSQVPKVVTTGTALQIPTLSGTSYPAQRTSTIDVDGNPTYPPQGKPLLQVDIDTDLAEEQKIWRRPGEDQSDYFNYGFDEFTWEIYRQRQITMANNLQQQKNDMVQMQQMMGGAMPGIPNMGGSGPNNGAPQGPGGGGGGMNEQQQMEMMFQQMVGQGMDPSQMDFGNFMQMAGQGMPGPGGFGGPGGQGGQQSGFQQGNQGGGVGGGGRGGRGRGRGGW